MDGPHQDRGAGIAQIELYIPRLFVDMAEQGNISLCQNGSTK